MASFKKLKSGWQFRVSYKDSGKYKTKSGNGFPNKREAQLAAAEFERKIHKGFDIKAADEPFASYFRNWFELYRKGKNSLNNDRDIERAVKFAEKEFSSIRLKDLSRKDYQKVLNSYGETHSTASVKKHHTYMRACIKDALEEGLIHRDPTYRSVVKGKVAPKKEELKYLNYEQVRSLTKVLYHGLKPEYTSRFIILFGIATGCRFSEIIGMTWDCIDFENAIVKINKTWDYKDSNDFSNTKNYQSKRVISLDHQTLKLLRKLKIYQNEIFFKRNIKNSKNLVFINDALVQVSNASVNRTLGRMCAKIDAIKVSCHSLRHTHASILLYRGANIKYVSKRLGHTSIVTTLQTYQHILDEMDQRESTQVNEMMLDLYNAK
ncbi:MULTISPECIES: site-specific integrase [Carnobacterium]|uniref:site-specific integrase n=1 Tax=Carnobacterium TaxID=2747 RepID=UPI00288FC077|nr:MULTISPECIES: site-specific integrase [Carnobacterium]MDT1939686.1 site-specific integrase [Carnobacterium divergens]MDT1942124.1 site-specific integrase [Carnobacterium divergens]MDT1947922.1 site-specific integrase [Carnobacterium divergens]MDT1950410.1 site-specific integrase [Carnobacterium divergens]MDT1955588.1 site-specific integrase [Carnobacterium divergens]